VYGRRGASDDDDMIGQHVRWRQRFRVVPIEDATAAAIA
jgi:hypothetical protein